MSNLPQTKKLYYALGGIILLLFLPLVLNDHLLTVAITGFMWAYLCICWNLVFGFAGQFSLGHALFWGIGAYTSTVLFVNYGLTPWVGIFLGGIVSAFVAWLISLVVLRYRVKGVYFALMTLAFAEVCMGLAMNWDFIRGPVGILLPMKNSPANLFFLKRGPYYYFILGLLALGLYVTYWVQKSKIGYYLKAVREDEDAAEVSGVSTSRYKTLAMVISAFLTALGGTFYAQFYLYISPEIMFGFGSQMAMMIGTMVGGAGTLFGPVLGSLAFSFLGEVLRSLPLAHSREIVTVERMVWALVLILVIFYLPGGLITLREKVKPRRGKSQN
ncbi:MAG: branched-chain amino acid ABC transporter permease [Deltaproteobacteria bacterium]|nr:branched-chain amino acid ABC transporter permease [Deltaproteobacteria bacterium]